MVFNLLFKLFGTFYFFKIKGHLLVQYPCGYLGHQNLGHQSIQKWPDMTSSLYVIYVSGHYWMFAVQITECVFSLKSLGLLTPTHPQFRTKS